MRSLLMTLASLALGLLLFGGAFSQEPAAGTTESVQAAPNKAALRKKEKTTDKSKKESTATEPSSKKPTKAESGVTTPTAEAEKPQPELDRRWIIKMKDEKGKKLPAREPVAIAWTGKDQQTRCEAYLPGLQEAFSKTRYYSVGGDACNTAGSAKAFLNLVRNCEKDCPKGFLEAKGYSRQIIRNVEILHQLGQKRCMESVREAGSVTPGKGPAKKETGNPGRR